MVQGRKSAGHPVDVASGELYSTHEDISIPGKVALTWERRYSTSLLNNSPTPLGSGWTTRYFATLTQNETGFIFVSPEGDTQEFADPEHTIDQGGIVRNLGPFQELSKRGSQYIITQWDVDTGEIERFVFNQGQKGAIRPLAGIEDVTGQGLDLFRDEAGRLSRIKQCLEQRSLVVDYTPENQISAVSFLSSEHQRQVLIRYEYDGQGRLTAAVDALNHTDQYEYDKNTMMTREFLKGGGVFDFKFDDQGRCIRTSGIDGYDEKNFRYLDHIGWTEVIDSLGEIKRYQWNPSGQIITEIDPLGGTTKTVYDEFDRIVEKTDANGNATRYEYDEQGNYAKITDVLGQTTIFTYNQSHQSVSYTNTTGHIWHRFYDFKNYLIGTKNPEGGSYHLAYDGNGNLTQITDPLNNHLGLTYSEFGVLESASDWEDHITRYRADTLGRVTETIDALGNPTRFQYDVLDNLIRVEYADNTHEAYGYDPAKRLTHILDRNGHATRFSFGSCGRLIERIDPQGLTIRFGWGNEPDQLKTVTNAKGEVYHFEYNAIGLVTREIGFDGRELNFEYDPTGNRIASVNGMGERIVYQRDALGRLVGQQLPDGGETEFKYDSAGFLVQTRNADSEILFKRDPIGRIVHEIQNSHVIERSFDAVGDLLQLRSASGLQIDYRFDANSRLSQFTVNGHEKTVLERDALGSEIQRTLPGRIALNQQFDDMGRLIEQALFSPSSFDTPKALIQRNYTYDKAQLVGINDQLWGKTKYVYDPSERLIQALRENGASENFHYDENDNITAIEQGDKTANLSYGLGDRLVSKDNTFFDYDDQGRLIRKIENLKNGDVQEWQYEWDALDQLRSVTNPDGETWQYAYDPFGRRIEKKSPEGQRFGFIWDEDVVLHESRDDAVFTSWIFDPYGFIPLCKLENEQLYSVITDHLGTPREMVDRYGRIAWRADYYVWGEVREKKAVEIDCPVKFQGQWFDEESGLHYNRFRYYDPNSGRFICCDPIGLIGGVNEYHYVTNPVRLIDPWGLLEKGDPLPEGTTVHRIGGGSPDNLQLKPQERRLNPPGISTLSGGSAQEAAQDMRTAFPRATGLHRASEITGSTNVDAIRAAGFDVIHDPTRNFPNHARLIHPDGEDGFNEENLKKLAKAFDDSCSK